MCLLSSKNERYHLKFCSNLAISSSEKKWESIVKYSQYIYITFELKKTLGQRLARRIEPFVHVYTLISVKTIQLLFYFFATKGYFTSNENYKKRTQWTEPNRTDPNLHDMIGDKARVTKLRKGTYPWPSNNPTFRAFNVENIG
jgi:hypothetical protein